MPETLTGQIERITSHNPENGFAVLRAHVRGHRDLVTVVGSVTSVTVGEHLETAGQWVVDKQHGRQFRAQDVRTTHPASAGGIRRHLASGVACPDHATAGEHRRHPRAKLSRNRRPAPSLILLVAEAVKGAPT